MAKMVLTAVGMGVGFALGGPMGAQIGAMVGSFAGNMLFPTKVEGPRLADLSVTASTYGNTIPKLYGTSRLSGNVIWSAGIKEHKHKSGGKGTGVQQSTYTYTCSWAIAFCEGPVDGITRIWADGKLISGSAPHKFSDNGNLLVEGVFAILSQTTKKTNKVKYRFYPGTEDQLPDSTIEADKGVGNCPAYRDLAYIVFIDMPLEDYGNRLPQIQAEITHQPKVTTPYVALQSDTTAYTDPGTQWSSKSATVDFEGGRFYKLYFDTNGQAWFIHYDLRTMAELFRVPVLPGENGQGVFTDPHLKGPMTEGPYGFNPCFSISGNYFWDNNSLHNSGSGGLWNANTGEWLGRIGHPSNDFPARPQADPSQPYYPEGATIGTWPATCMWFRLVDTTINGTENEDYLYQTGNLGSSAIVFDASRYPVHWIESYPFGNAADWTPLRGKEEPGALITGTPASTDLLLVNSQFIAGTGHDVWLKRLNLVKLAKMYAPTGNTLINRTLVNTEADITLPRPVAGQDFSMQNCAYDKSDNSLVIWGTSGADVNTGNGGDWCFCKYLIDENTYLWVKTPADLDPSLASGSYSAAQMVGYPTDIATASNLDGGTVGWMRPTQPFTGSALYVADLQTGKIKISVPSPLANYADDTWAMNAWDDDTQSVMGSPERVFVNKQGSGVTLQSIVDSVMNDTGALEPEVDWDSNALSGIDVHGYVVGRDSSARDIVMQLAGAYFFDGVESDYKVKFTLRGGPSIATITEPYIAFSKNKDITVQQTRAQEVELPMRVTVNYSDKDRNYQTGSQYAKRNSNPFPTMHSHTEMKFELPITMTATDAKQIADKSLKMAWNGRLTYKMKWPWYFLKYDPSDVLTVVTDKGNTYEMRLSKLGMGVDFSLDTEGTSDQSANYVSSVVAADGGSVPTQIVRSAGPVNLLIFNTPLLRDSDDTQGIGSVYYMAVTPQSPGDFSGAVIYEAADVNATDYENLDTISTEPLWGTCLTALPAVNTYAMDTTTAIYVRVMALDSNYQVRTLESCTLDDLNSGKNAALIGNEVIQFMTATVQPDGKTYMLTNLLRARRGTNYAVPYHSAGEPFILLDSASLLKEANQPSLWSANHFFKAVQPGEYAENVNPVTLTMAPNDLKPYTPECVKATDDGTNVNITFERRSRISNELHDGDANVLYREGQGSLAHFVYKVYTNTTLADGVWNTDPSPVAFTGQVPVYSGVSFAPLTFNFPLAGVNSFVVVIYEVGYVDGFPKVVQFDRINPGNWDMTELY